MVIQTFKDIAKIHFIVNFLLFIPLPDYKHSPKESIDLTPLCDFEWVAKIRLLVKKLVI